MMDDVLYLYAKCAGRLNPMTPLELAAKSITINIAGYNDMVAIVLIIIISMKS